MTERIERTEDLFLLDMGSALPAEEGQVRQANGDIVAFIGGVVKSLTAGAGGGITEPQHEALDTLVHEIDETSYEEHAYVAGNVASVVVWASAAKLLKIREEQYTYSQGRIATATTIQYDGAGSVKMMMTEVYSYSGGRISDVVRTKT